MASPSQSGGYGLGLAIVAEIAAVFGAACQYDAGPDDGRGLRVVCLFETGP
jgi:C4-dicarboxylate-specific signal transduction histidine kinase